MNTKSVISTARDETGATAVEFAVVVALLLIILLGILELGFIFLQKHFVANAAREGVRIGIRANNFDSFTSLTSNTVDGCNQSATNRAYKVDCEVRNYLNTLYQRAEPMVSVARVPSSPDGIEERLDVTVTVPNFFPELLSGLVPGFAAPDQFTYTASGDYENPEEALTE
jgi:Flp pilus assembly pilin Flp